MEIIDMEHFLINLLKRQFYTCWMLQRNFPHSSVSMPDFSSVFHGVADFPFFL